MDTVGPFRFTSLTRLWHDGNVSKLSEVIVQGDGRADLQIVDHDLAGAIGKTPAGTMLRLKDDPGAPDLIGREKMQIAQFFLEQFPADSDSQIGTSASHQQRQQ